jgi:putative transposase
VDERRGLVEPAHPDLSIERQCDLVELARSSYYYQPVPAKPEDLHLMRLLDEQYLRTPFYGSRRMTVWLQQQGHEVNRKRVQRLMRLMGLVGIAPGPGTSRPHPPHPVYPYLLRDTVVERPNQVWCSDITYVPMPVGFLYLVVVMDWFSRYVLAWELSNSLEVGFCLVALERALARCQPEIFNSDQGAQFTSSTFTERLAQAQVRISMDGRGRTFDNIFVERLWRTVKYEDIYLKAYPTGSALYHGLRGYFEFYNQARPHQGLDYQTPAAVYSGGRRDNGTPRLS